MKTEQRVEVTSFSKPSNAPPASKSTFETPLHSRSVRCFCIRNFRWVVVGRLLRQAGLGVSNLDVRGWFLGGLRGRRLAGSSSGRWGFPRRRACAPGARPGPAAFVFEDQDAAFGRSLATALRLQMQQPGLVAEDPVGGRDALPFQAEGAIQLLRAGALAMEIRRR